MSDNSQFKSEDLSNPKTPFEYLRLYFSGFAMGSADIVPGVSGGTMAFILGIYETLINAIKSADTDVIRMALKFDVKGVIDHIPFRFIIALGLGIASAVLLLANLLHDLLTDQPTFIFAFFAGLIVASILAIGIKVKWTSSAIIAFVIATIFAFLLVGFSSDENDPVADVVHAVEDGAGVTEAQNALVEALQAQNVDNPAVLAQELVTAAGSGENLGDVEDSLTELLYEPSSPLVLFFSGMIAICAMLLPGISGSFILLIMGQYTVVLGAVKTLDIVSIAAVGAGAVVGIIAFSRVISWLLKNHEDITIAGLVGFMLGSLRLIWMQAANGVSVVSDTNSLVGSQVVLVVVLAVFGFLFVSLLDHLQSRTNPVFAWFWKPVPPVDVIAERAEALD
ncbi:MAG: DUF368 domain-containing protein [Aggregatilineales bacterium]